MPVKRKCAEGKSYAVDDEIDEIEESGGSFASQGFTTPELRPINHSIYANELFYDEMRDREFLVAIRKSYSNMQKIFFEHHSERARGRRPAQSTFDAIPMHLEYSSDVWKLFLGRDQSADPITYAHIDGLLLNKDTPDVQLEQLKTDRLNFHKELLADREFVHVLVDDVVWRITREHPVPWMIPVQFSWYNNRAVSPATATLSEMFECSRIEDTNRILFETDALFKHLLQHLMYLEKHVMFDAKRAPKGTICSLATSWFRPNYVFFKRCFKVMVLHDEKIQWSLFLAFEKSLIDRNKPKIIVPKDTVIASLDGEVRPLDLFSKDLYALELIGACRNNWFADKDALNPEEISYLVSTFFCCDNRPAVGGSGFFANTTCASDVWFCCMSHWLDSKRTGTIISNSQNSYRHSMLTTSKDITGQMIIDRNWIVAGIDDLYLLPVEWHYTRSETAAEGSEIECNCMTNCHKKPIDQKKKIMVNTTSLERPPAEWTAEKLATVEGLKQTKKDGILSYITKYSGRD